MKLTQVKPTRPNRHKPCGRSCRNAKRHGFTLIETALATIIVGVGVLAIMAAQQGFHQQNGWSSHSSIATRLGNEIREMTFNLPRHDPVTGDSYWGIEAGEILNTFDDLDDFDGVIFSAALDNGPINAQRQIIPNMEGWSQIVLVENTLPTDITVSGEPVVANASTNVIKVTVIIEYQGPNDDDPTEMTRVAWISPK